MKAKQWILYWIISVLSILLIIGVTVYKVDPYFHYHKPDIEKYFYVLNNQRSQNDGITKHFDYDALITGTSMTENFKTSEMDELFGVHSIKVPYSGGSYKEINDNLKKALEYNPNLKLVVRGLDMGKFFDDKDQMREDLGTYPTYLYDNNPFNDVDYLYNKDVIFSRIYEMLSAKRQEGFLPGITSFDEYSCWQANYSFGRKSAIQRDSTGELRDENQNKGEHLSVIEKKTVNENITQNVTSLADQNPEVEFYYFFTPYSIMWWKSIVDSGEIERQIEAEQYIIELILQHKNIHLYSFNNRADITTDLNNYKDEIHYGEWVNSLIFKWIHDGKYLLTEENYKNYLQKEYAFYTSFDYLSLIDQTDYESDFYAAALLNKELTGEEPIEILTSDVVKIELSGAEIVNEQYEGTLGIQCAAIEHKTTELQEKINENFGRVQIRIDDIGHRRYLTFYGKKLKDCGEPLVNIYDAEGQEIAGLGESYEEMEDGCWHQYVIKLPKGSGTVQMVFSGGYTNKEEDIEPAYVFSNLKLY